MSYTIGLDFGTHQTKICVEDASNPAQKIYEFIEFKNLKGKSDYFFPSIVQINNDDTVSYGFVEEKRVKNTGFKQGEKPILTLPTKPNLEQYKYKYPEKPKKKDVKGYSMKDQLEYRQIFNREEKEWKKNILEIDLLNKKIEEDLQNKYNEDVRKTNKLYNKNLKEWEEKVPPKKFLFRYFKLLTYTGKDWGFEISPKIVSVWYLTYILFNLEKKYGNDFFIQMGVPDSSGKNSENSMIARNLLISANLLMREYKCLDDFLKAKYTELLKFDYNQTSDDDFGISILPEAYAGLKSVTNNKVLERGFHLLIDIGGGTTDISIFMIDLENHRPDILSVNYFAEGLNSIYEEYSKLNNIPIAQIKDTFYSEYSKFKEPISKYHDKLKEFANKLVKELEDSYNVEKDRHGHHIKVFYKAITGKPVLYCGGGSLNPIMRREIGLMNDIKLIDKNLLKIPYLKNNNIEKSFFTLLATSYGLSQQEESELIMTPISGVFKHYQEKINDYEIPDDFHNIDI